MLYIVTGFCVIINVVLLLTNPNYVVQGLTGFQGPLGFQGLRGESSIVKGLPGLPGPAGPEGHAGERGPQGFTGISGVQGFQGQQGFQGNQGAQGFQGQSIVGTTGFQGYQGNQGHIGILGFNSQLGVQGFPGFQGNPGVLYGYQGFQGPQGYQGPILIGAQGSQGWSSDLEPSQQGYQGDIGPYADVHFSSMEIQLQPRIYHYDGSHSIFAVFDNFDFTQNIPIIGINYDNVFLNTNAKLILRGIITNTPSTSTNLQSNQVYTFNFSFAPYYAQVQNSAIINSTNVSVTCKSPLFTERLPQDIITAYNLVPFKSPMTIEFFLQNVSAQGLYYKFMILTVMTGPIATTLTETLVTIVGKQSQSL